MDWSEGDGPTLIQDAEQGNAFAIKAVQKAPKLGPRGFFYWSAFRDLWSERNMGMGEGPIPRSAARTYAREELHLTPREIEAFLHIISRTDLHYLALKSKKLNKGNS